MHIILVPRKGPITAHNHLVPAPPSGVRTSFLERSPTHFSLEQKLPPGERQGFLSSMLWALRVPKLVRPIVYGPDFATTLSRGSFLASIPHEIYISENAIYGCSTLLKYKYALSTPLFGPVSLSSSTNKSENIFRLFCTFNLPKYSEYILPS